MEKDCMKEGIKVICRICEEEAPGEEIFAHDGPEKLAHTGEHEHKGDICLGTGYLNPVV